MICANQVYFIREGHASIVLFIVCPALRPYAVHVRLVLLLSDRVALAVQFLCLIAWNAGVELNVHFARSDISTMRGRGHACFVRL